MPRRRRPEPSDSTLLSIEAVERLLNRSRASIYRYANLSPDILNLPFRADRLNPELRTSREEPLSFHPNEVARFARDILGIQQVSIEVVQPEETITHDLLRQILTELQAIRQALTDK